MAALSAVTPTTTGVVVAGAAVSASDTIDAATLGSQGAYLIIINGNASTDNVTISDNGTTAAGNSLASNTFSASVTNGTSKVFFIHPLQVNPSTGLVTITHSVTATVTYQLVKNIL
jgi:hypothetical protein